MNFFRKMPKWTFLALLLILGVLTLYAFQKYREKPAVSIGDIVVDYTSPVRKIDNIAVGMDVSGYGYPNVFAEDALERQKLQTLGVRYVRIDLKYLITGDITSQIVCASEGCDAQVTGDQWIRAIKSIGAEPAIVVPADHALDAANMVRHFNQDTNNPVQYWIVGNEPDLSHVSATMYSLNFNQTYGAMKAVDSTIAIGGGATAWYDQPFLEIFLRQSGSRVDFIDFHGYAQQGYAPGDTRTLFQVAANYGSNINSLRSMIQRIVPVRASRIGIEVGEWELNWGGAAQANTNFHAIWAASVLGHIISAGGWSLFYNDKDNALYGSQDTMTDAAGHIVRIHVDDSNPAYHGLGMFTGEGLFRSFGDTLVQADSALPDIEVYASDNPRNIVVINKNPSTSRTAKIVLRGAKSPDALDVWRKDESVLFTDAPVKVGTLSLSDATFTYRFPPFSVTTFVLGAQETLLPPTPPLPAPIAALMPALSLVYIYKAQASV